LIFKECVHNMVRHAGCRKVRIEMLMRGGSLVLRMSDDGKGFAQEGNGDGHGLVSMKRRSVEAGGDLEISSEPGCGTSVVLRVPLKAG
ncbi:MAG TPA: ATP-binding protein, partial [Bryobacteraceae bacterium]|nr:ATP-binding protein [Bryobacteraceae bacterium]